MDEKVKIRECTTGQNSVRFTDEHTGAIDKEVCRGTDE